MNGLLASGGAGGMFSIILVYAGDGCFYGSRRYSIDNKWILRCTDRYHRR